MEPGMSFFTSGKEGHHVNDVAIVLNDVLHGSQSDDLATFFLNT